MESKEAASMAVYNPNPIIDGRKTNVNLAYLGVKSKLNQQTGNKTKKKRYHILYL